MPNENRSSAVAEELAAWAKASSCSETAVLLLISAFDGRFARPGWPWIAVAGHSGDNYVDAKRLTDDDIGMLSGGEQRVLAITRSLLGEKPVDLSDALPSLDQPTTRLVLGALTHATGGAPRPFPHQLLADRTTRSRSAVGLKASLDFRRSGLH